MTPNDFLQADNHKHVAKHRGAVYEVCDCGATRQYMGLVNAWHVCHSCVAPGYKFTVSGFIRKEAVK